MRRLLVWLLVAAAALVVVRLLAPLVVLAALALVAIAARWPQVLERVLGHPWVVRLPHGLRSTPMRLAGTAVIASIMVAGTAYAVAPPASDPVPTPSGVAQATSEPTPRATPRATPEPTARPTSSPRPAATVRPTPEATPEPTPIFGQEPTGPVQVATVASVTDGDTIRVLLDGQNVPVRYIGIDTPETQSGIEWMGQEATAANARLVEGRQVLLEKDVSETDQFGRLLRHVWVEADAGWLLVSLELLRLGVAEVTTYPPDVKYVDELFFPAQRRARDAGVGLWGTPPEAAASPAPGGGGNCEPSYPDVCIPIGSADLDCGDIDARRFTVLWNVPNPDPHRFDGNADGVGCERD